VTLEDDKDLIRRLNKKIENLEVTVECARIDMGKHNVGRDLQNKIIDALNSIIRTKNIEIKRINDRLIKTHQLDN